MPDLLQSLQKRDRGHLQVVAGRWGLDLEASATEAALQELCAQLLDASLLAEVLSALPAESLAALEALRARDGRMPWAEFTRRFGEIREMGPGRRDRERPHLDPASPAEALFFRALLARAFFDTPSGPREFAYVPDDLFALMAAGAGASDGAEPPSLAAPPGRAASPSEKAHPLPGGDFLLDDATTLLAALRLGLSPPAELRLPAAGLQALLQAGGLLAGTRPQPEPIRLFLEAPREQAMQILREAWAGSEQFNELRQVPGLVSEGEWQNHPRETRAFLLGLLDAIPEGRWWSLAAFIQDVKVAHPDFQRPAGEYDSWFIRRASDGAFLRGFEHWEQVDGALLRYTLTGPCHWLGLVDLAAPGPDRPAAAFRRAPRGGTGRPERARWHVSSRGDIRVPAGTPRAARYQVSRFCEWETARGGEYRYRITAASLERARRQGLDSELLPPLLGAHSVSGVPPALVKAIARWQDSGTEALLERQVVLKVRQPEILQALRESRAGRFLGETLGPTAVVVADGAQDRVLAALAELGYLAHDESSAGRAGS